MKQTYKVLSIDAWGNADEGYEWNNWFNVGTIEIDINSSESDVMQTMFDAGFITNTHGVYVVDDQYNLVICDKQTNEPLLAIEYGSVIDGVTA